MDNPISSNSAGTKAPLDWYEAIMTDPRPTRKAAHLSLLLAALLYLAGAGLEPWAHVAFSHGDDYRVVATADPLAPSAPDRPAPDGDDDCEICEALASGAAPSATVSISAGQTTFQPPLPIATDVVIRHATAPSPARAPPGA